MTSKTAVNAMMGCVQLCAHLSIKQEYDQFQVQVYEAVRNKGLLREFEVCAPLRTVAATAWEYLGGSPNNDKHLAVLSMIGGTAIGLQREALFRLGKVQPTPEKNEVQKLWELCKAIEADEPVRDYVKRGKFASIRNGLSVWLASRPPTGVDGVLDKLSLLVWKRLGGDVMHTSYSSLFQKVTANWDIAEVRAGIGMLEVKDCCLTGKPLPPCYEAKIEGDNIIVNEAKVVTDEYGKVTVRDHAKEGHIWGTGTKYLTGDEYVPLKAKAGYEQVTIHRGSDGRISKLDYADAELRVLAAGAESRLWLVTNFSDNPWQILSGTASTPQTCTIQQPPKEDTMKAYQTVNYVYGNDITTLTTEQLIAAIKKAEGERNALDGVKTPSKKIKAMQAELDDAVAKMVAALDAKA